MAQAIATITKRIIIPIAPAASSDKGIIFNSPAAPSKNIQIGERIHRLTPNDTLGASSFLMANMVNNIPMSILFADVPLALNGQAYYQATYATIIGSNTGAFLTPVGALAGIMFQSLLSKYGVKFTFKDFVKYGSIISVPVIASALSMLIIFF